MSDLPSPKVSRDRTFPIIWVVPLIALAVGIWMGVTELQKRGPEITISFADGLAVEAGKTMLEYKGVSAGTVESVELEPGLTGVRITVRLLKSAASLASEGSRFWIRKPEISLSGVRGLDTLVTGVRLNVLPGTGKPALHFTGLDKEPAPNVVDQGRTFILKAERLGSLTTGAPVYYREFKVGSVEASHLSDDSTAVLIRIHIDAAYANLVRTNTVFWNAGGFSFKVSLFGGAEVKDTSLESLISGGVAFATPDDVPLPPAAPNESTFTLALEAGKDWLKWSPKIPITSQEAVLKNRAAEGILPALLKR